MTSALTILIVLASFLAFANGANDNFKGVATLLGSRTTNFKIALAWATLTTFAGSVMAIFLAQKLMVNFSGKGLVPDDVVRMSSFASSVALAAAGTVFLATKLGFPISTTHALTGALVGSGFLASNGQVHLGKLGSSFFLPLLISPLLAIVSVAVIYPIFKLLRKRSGIERKSCVCLGKEILAVAPAGLSGPATSVANVQLVSFPYLSIGTEVTCEQRYVGQFIGLKAKNVLDFCHFISSGLVSFARGLNDTPKIAALILAAGSFLPSTNLAMVGAAMALGGILMARRIAETMAYQITEMNDGQGFTANLVTSGIVIGASQLGMPVSTTHVSCGALFGIGALSGTAHWRMILKIVMAWLITLPVAAALGGASFLLLNRWL